MVLPLYIWLYARREHTGGVGERIDMQLRRVLRPSACRRGEFCTASGTKCMPTIIAFCSSMLYCLSARPECKAQRPRAESTLKNVKMYQLGVDCTYQLGLHEMSEMYA